MTRRRKSSSAQTFNRWAGPNDNQRKQAWDEIKIAQSLHAKTKREREYIAAETAVFEPPRKHAKDNRYLKRMAKLCRDFPDDHEAAAFYALGLESTDPDDDQTHAQRKRGLRSWKSYSRLSRTIRRII